LYGPKVKLSKCLWRHYTNTTDMIVQYIFKVDICRKTWIGYITQHSSPYLSSGSRNSFLYSLYILLLTLFPSCMRYLTLG